MTSATESHVPASTPMPVPATTSRPRKPSTDVTSCSGTTNADQHERDVVALGRLEPVELEAADQQRAAGEGEEAERQRVGERPQDDAHDVARRVRSLIAPPPGPGARPPSSGSAQPRELDGGLALAALHHREQLAVAGALGGLADERPRHVALGRP